MHRPMTLTLASLMLSLSPAAFGAEPLATASSATHDPLVEISWRDGAHEGGRIAVALPPEKSCSRVEVDHERRNVQLSVCRTGGDAESPLLELAIERFDSASAASAVATMKLRASVRLRRGASMPIGRFVRGEQPSEVLAALR